MPNIESWQKARELLKHNRRELTDSIQNWIEKEKDASDKWVTPLLPTSKDGGFSGDKRSNGVRFSNATTKLLMALTL
jgi:hypothetical protein